MRAAHPVQQRAFEAAQRDAHVLVPKRAGRRVHSVEEKTRQASQGEIKRELSEACAGTYLSLPALCGSASASVPVPRLFQVEQNSNRDADGRAERPERRESGACDWDVAIWGR